MPDAAAAAAAVAHGNNSVFVTSANHLSQMDAADAILIEYYR